MADHISSQTFLVYNLKKKSCAINVFCLILNLVDRKSYYIEFLKNKIIMLYVLLINADLLISFRKYLSQLIFIDFIYFN